jgi:alpha-ketoglutarate-dependent taurine dioxygenase
MLASKALKALIGSELSVPADVLLSGASAEELRSLLMERGVLIFRDLDITTDQQRDITATLGRLQADVAGEAVLQKVTNDPAVSPEYAAYFWTTFFWHIDGHYAQTLPCFGASLRPERLPEEGGATEFLNAYAAYEGLAEQDRRLADGLRVVHSMTASGLAAMPDATDEQFAGWRRLPPATQPLVWQHETGRKSLMLGGSVSHVEGMHAADSYDLLSRLRQHMTRDEYVYSHDWRPGDLLIWNNTGVMHRARPFAASSGRLLHRFTLEGEEPIRAPTM